MAVVGRLGCHVRQKSMLLCFSLSAHHFATGAESPAGEELGRGGCPTSSLTGLGHTLQVPSPKQKGLSQAVLDSCGAGEVTQVERSLGSELGRSRGAGEGLPVTGCLQEVIAGTRDQARAWNSPAGSCSRNYATPRGQNVK